MNAIATVRIRTRAGSRTSKPEPALVEEAARLLRQLGFEVLRVGRFGVSIEGDEEIFHRELSVRVRAGKGSVDQAHPRSEPLAELIDMVEVTPPTTQFST